MIHYPKIIGEEKEPFFLEQLQDAYAGENGEFTEISRYIYQHLDVNDSQLSKSLMAIAKVEMYHLDILGCILKQSGKTPYYRNHKGQYWGASEVNYQTKNIKEMLSYNMEEEKRAIHSYMNLKQNTTNSSIQAMLDRIIIDETAHIKFFEAYLKAYETGMTKERSIH